ncbi:MAG: hypothetical protein FE78DRAFT_74043 [Acidomyces sp. 'richmondensis']|nr:MAG: hypothetical protein FE78DRAFT_74043 [Acidomyces sp. 'richmondensis']
MALSWARTAALFLPLPTWVPAIATLISPIAALVLLATRFCSPPSTPRNCRWSRISSILSQIQNVISTIVATVALAYLFPDRILFCNLDQQWQGFFQSKNSHAIRSIQDEFRCCGLGSLHDRAEGPSKTGTTGTTRVVATRISEELLRSLERAAAEYILDDICCSRFCFRGQDRFRSAFRLTNELDEHAIRQQATRLQASFTPGSTGRRGRGERCPRGGAESILTPVEHTEPERLEGRLFAAKS